MKAFLEIVVTQRVVDYHAALATDPAVWGCGKTEEEAIGDLVRSHPEVFNVSVKTQS